MPSFTNSDVSYAKHTLDYPVYAADFDPYNRGYLVVAGGGGEGRSGVPNKISVLDINNRATIEPVVEIDLSREEDSIQSLANLATKDGLITLAGINSSSAAQNENKNEHFRAFDVRYPPRKKQKTDEKVGSSSEKGDIKLLGKRSLFKSSSAPKKETYQRLLRLSPVGKRDAPGRRIGAIASGFAKESEVIVFDATAAIPDDKDVIARIDLDKHEAADLDITRIADDDLFSLAYCDEHTIWEQTYKYDFSKKKVEKRPNGPRRAYQMATGDSYQAKGSRPKFKALRFLNSENLVALINKPNKSGAELRVYHLYPTGPALVMQTKTLPGHIKQATSLDVGVLDADKVGNQQFTLAVSGQDSSIEVLTVNYQAMTDTFSSIRSYMALRDVHKQGITKICWQPFHSPIRAADPGATTGKSGEPVPPQRPQHPGPQYARLASVSFGNTLVIETFPLVPLEPKDKDSRYVLSHPTDERFWTLTVYGLFLFVGLVTSLLFYSFLSAGSSWNIVPNSASKILEKPAAAQHSDILSQAKVPDIVVPTAASDLKDALAEHHASPEDAAATAVIVHDLPDGEGVSIAVHPDKGAYLAHESTDAKHWDELEPQQQSYWKGKLKKAGQWAEHEGESVLKGVLWSTVPQFLMGQAGEILREL